MPSWTRVLVVLLPLWLAARALAGEADADVSRLPVDAVILGSGAAVARVREAAGELLAREGFVVSWSSPERLTPEQIVDVRASGEHRGAIAVWIDLQSPAAAGLYLRDGRLDRFVVRRLRLLRGLDEIAKEEIAQIVTSVVVALDAGTTPTLSRAEARVALTSGSDVAPRDGEREALAQSPEDRRSSPRLELGPVATAQLFSRAIPLIFGFEISAEVLAQPVRSGLPGTWGAWLSAGGQLPSHHADAEIAVDLRTVRLRAGASWQVAPFRAVSFQLSAGGGVDWVDYQPHSLDPSVTAAPQSSFFAPVARLAAGVRVTPRERWAITVAAVGEVAATNVHFDLREPGGARRAVVPYVFRPGLAAGTSWQF